MPIATNGPGATVGSSPTACNGKENKPVAEASGFLLVAAPLCCPYTGQKAGPVSSKGPSGAVQGPGERGERARRVLHSWSHQTPQPGVWSRKPHSEPYGGAHFPAGIHRDLVGSSQALLPPLSDLEPRLFSSVECGGG